MNTTQDPIFFLCVHMQTEQTKLVRLHHTEIYFHRDISKIHTHKKKKEIESNHLCVADVSQETAAQCAVEEVCEIHASSKNLRFLRITTAVQKEKKILHG